MNYLIYRGPSQFNGQPIFSALTGTHRPSENPKTGPMSQVWVLHEGTTPTQAVRTGEDAAICGDCPLRGKNGSQRACYVKVYQAPTAVFRGKDAMVPYRRDAVRNRAVRLGAYGEMTALPVDCTAQLVKDAIMTTGYTHQWRAGIDPDFKRFLMASCESPEDRERAKEAGWSTFRIRKAGDPLLPGEINCPASKEAGFRKQCISCGLCSGKDQRVNAPDISIIVHGSGARHFVSVAP